MKRTLAPVRDILSFSSWQHRHAIRPQVLIVSRWRTVSGLRIRNASVMDQCRFR